MKTGTFPGYIVKNGVPATLGALAPEGPTIGSHNNSPGMAPHRRDSRLQRSPRAENRRIHGAGQAREIDPVLDDHTHKRRWR